MQYTATAFYSDGTQKNVTTKATWASKDTTIATISNATGSEGLAKGVKVGGTTIIATYKGVSGNTPLTVTAATLDSVEVTPASDTIVVGTTLQYTATAIYSDGTQKNVTRNATWSSSSPKIASISNAKGTEGLAMGLAVGRTKITADFDGMTDTADLTVTAPTLTSIDVTPISSKISIGARQQYTATANYSDGSHQDVTKAATWSSSDPKVAGISNAAGFEGLARGYAAGTVTITAEYLTLKDTAALIVLR